VAQEHFILVQAATPEHRALDHISQLVADMEPIDKINTVAE
jgi:hypothetical protein